MINKKTENKYDGINFQKYKLPKFHQLVHTENVFSIIEQWPSHSTSRHSPINHILLQKKRLIVLDEPHSKMLKTVPQPKFLKHLEDYVRDQFKKHSIKDNERNPVRLQVYREVFDWIIEAFKTYQPLLSKIKKEYELNLSYLGDEIRRLEPMKEVLWTIAEDRDQQVLRLKRKENFEIIHLKEENHTLSQRIVEFESNMDTLNCQINKLSDNLGQEHGAYRKEADTKKLLIIDINEMKTHLEDMSIIKKDAEVEEEDVIMLRYAIEEAKKAQALAVKQYSDMKATYGDVIPIIKFHKLRDRFENLLLEEKVVIEKLSISEKSLRSLDEKYKALLKQRDFYYFKYMELARSAPNPSQTWDKLSEFVSGGIDKWQEATNKDRDPTSIANVIFEEIKDNQSIKNVSMIKFESDDSSNDGKDETSKLQSRGTSKHVQVTESENKAVMRTMIEMMCELPPGTINPNFDPLNLLHILNKEKARRDNSVKDSKNVKKKHTD